MPGFDGTGPQGMGPMTGGGRGFCSPWGVGAAMRGNRPFSRIGYGTPRYGAQTPYPFYAGTPFTPQMTREQELAYLKNETDMLKGQLEQIEARMHDLGTKKE